MRHELRVHGQFSDAVSGWRHDEGNRLRPDRATENVYWSRTMSGIEKEIVTICALFFLTAVVWLTAASGLAPAGFVT